MADWTDFHSSPTFRRGNPSRIRATYRQIPAHATKILHRLRFVCFFFSSKISFAFLKWFHVIRPILFFLLRLFSIPLCPRRHSVSLFRAMQILIRGNMRLINPTWNTATIRNTNRKNSFVSPFQKKMKLSFSRLAILHLTINLFFPGSDVFKEMPGWWGLPQPT